MWFNLAAAQGNKNSTKNRDIVEKRMTTSDLSKAQRMALQWRPGQQSAVPRASGPTAAGKRIANVQRGLAALGYDPGPVDGILGPKTRAAIRAFQVREKRPVTGVVSEELTGGPTIGEWRGRGPQGGAIAMAHRTRSGDNRQPDHKDRPCPAAPTHMAMASPSR